MTEKENEAIELLKQPPELPFIYVERENAIRIVLKLIKKQQKEIEEKTTILFAGAEKVKQLEKEIEELKKPKYILNTDTNTITKLDNDVISKDKIREIISKYVDIEEHINYTSQELYGEDLKNMILELLEGE